MSFHTKNRDYEGSVTQLHAWSGDRPYSEQQSCDYDPPDPSGGLGQVLNEASVDSTQCTTLDLTH